MPNDEVQLADALLRLKANAHAGTLWTNQEWATVEYCMQREGVVSICAACCILSSGQQKGYRRSLLIISEAIKRKNLPPYAQLLTYEALIAVETPLLEPFKDDLFSFIEQSIAKRPVNLDNTVALIGNLARAGDTRALAILRNLAQDKDPGIADNAARILQGLD